MAIEIFLQEVEHNELNQNLAYICQPGMKYDVSEYKINHKHMLVNLM